MFGDLVSPPAAEWALRTTKIQTTNCTKLFIEQGLPRFCPKLDMKVEEKTLNICLDIFRLASSWGLPGRIWRIFNRRWSRPIYQFYMNWNYLRVFGRQLHFLLLIIVECNPLGGQTMFGNICVLDHVFDQKNWTKGTLQNTVVACGKPKRNKLLHLWLKLDHFVILCIHSFRTTQQLIYEARLSLRFGC